MIDYATFTNGLTTWQIVLRFVIVISLLISGLFISIIDFKKRIIPNTLVIIWLILGITNLFTYIEVKEGGAIDWTGMILPASTFGVFILMGLGLFFWLGDSQFGGGDAKLMMTLGAFMGTMNHVFWFAIVSFLTALVVFAFAKIKHIKSIPAGPIYAFSAVVPYAFCSLPWYVGLTITLLFISVFTISCYMLWKRGLIEPFESNE